MSTKAAKQSHTALRDDKRESGQPGGGKGRVDRMGKSGVYPASGPLPEGEAEVHGMASWGQGKRGAAGYADHGASEVPDRKDYEELGAPLPDRPKKTSAKRST